MRGRKKQPDTNCSRMCPNSHDLWELGYSCILIVLLIRILTYTYFCLLKAGSQYDANPLCCAVVLVCRHAVCYPVFPAVV